jgi:hypothetical protein
MTDQQYVKAAEALSARLGIGSWDALMRTLLDELADVRLPEEVAPAYVAARVYWAGEAGDLQAAKDLCWRYLDDLGRPLADRDVRLTRALLCVLEPNGDSEDLSMTDEWFSAMVAGESGD